MTQRGMCGSYVCIYMLVGSIYVLLSMEIQNIKKRERNRETGNHNACILPKGLYIWANGE